jgi:hypothetical protein
MSFDFSLRLLRDRYEAMYFVSGVISEFEIDTLYLACIVLWHQLWS